MTKHLVDLGDLTQLQTAEACTGYKPASLVTFSSLCTDFPSPVLQIGGTNLYLRSELAAWALERRNNARRPKSNTV
jgi:hypothetical protein